MDSEKKNTHEGLDAISILHTLSTHNTTRVFFAVDINHYMYLHLYRCVSTEHISFASSIYILHHCINVTK